MATQKKIATVANLQAKLDSAKGVILVDYRGLTCKQTDDLRKNLRTVGARLMIAKNSLLSRAMSSFPTIQLSTGPTALITTESADFSAIKILAKFIKDFNLPQIKLGFLENQMLDPEQVLALAKIPSREILLTKLVSTLKGPEYRLAFGLKNNLYKLVGVLGQIANKK